MPRGEGIESGRHGYMTWTLRYQHPRHTKLLEGIVSVRMHLRGEFSRKVVKTDSHRDTPSKISSPGATSNLLSAEAILDCPWIPVLTPAAQALSSTGKTRAIHTCLAPSGKAG